jgi:hypothetical protein
MTAKNSKVINNGGNSRNRKDVNNCRTPTTAERPTTACMLK